MTENAEVLKSGIAPAARHFCGAQVAYAAGALTHVLLFAGYGLFKNEVIGSAGLLVYAAAIGFTPIILAAVASRFFKPELLRPVAMRQATA